MRDKLIRLTFPAILSALALGLAACGGSDSPESADLGPDPAAMVPADAPLVVEAVVRPEGDLSSNLESALGKLLVTDDAGAKITDAIDDMLAEEDLSYEADIAPWLGPRAGVFLNGYDSAAGDVQGAIVLAVTDQDAAQSFLDKAEPSGKATDYNGVSVTTDEADDSSVAIDGDFMVAGSVQGVEDAIDAGDGENFAGLGEEQTELDEIPDDSIFSVYADPTGIVDLIQSSGAVSESDLRGVDEQIAQLGDGPIYAWGTVTESSFGLGGSAPASSEGGEPTDLLTTLPADSWLAFAAGDVGEQIVNSLDQFELGFEAGLDQAGGQLGVGRNLDPLAIVEEATGIDLEKDLAWIGDVGGFVEGTSIFGLGGGIVITTDDEAAATDAVGKLQQAVSGSRDVQVTPSDTGFSVQARGLPIGAEVAVEDGKVVAAAGADSVDDILSPSETLADSDTFQAAEDVLGSDLTPAFFLNFAPILDLIDSTGQTDSEIESARPYLNAMDFLIAGSDRDDDRSVFGLTLGVQEQPEDDSSSTSAVVGP